MTHSGSAWTRKLNSVTIKDSYPLPRIDKLKPNQCHFFQKEVVYLGHVVNEDGTATYQSKLEAIKNWPTLKDVGDIRSGLG